MSPLPDSFGGPIALFAACLASGIVMPLPEDLALLVAGWQIREGTLGLVPSLVASLGVFGRDALCFGAGRWAGPRLEQWGWLRRRIGERRLANARVHFARHGNRIVFATRFAVGFRATLYFLAGAMQVPTARFAWLDAVGLAFTTPLCLWLGFRYGPDAASWLTDVLAHQRLLAGAAFAAALLWLIWWRGQRVPELDP